eukprot:scaffold38935_cov63-Phaeocystis_antarctica.AAC.4
MTVWSSTASTTDAILRGLEGVPVVRVRLRLGLGLRLRPRLGLRLRVGVRLRLGLRLRLRVGVELDGAAALLRTEAVPPLVPPLGALEPLISAAW